MGQLKTISDTNETWRAMLAEERARIVSGLHDNMGNSLIASINNLNLAMMKATIEEAWPYLDMAAASVSTAIMKLRRIVEGLSPVDFNRSRLVPMLESVFNRVAASGVNVIFQMIGQPESLPAQLKEFIYNTCQESLTNSIMHGRADTVIIKLEETNGTLKIHIADNGQGCQSINKNNGLHMMEDRTRFLGGKISFGSPSSGGFSIHAEIPIEEFRGNGYYDQSFAG